MKSPLETHIGKQLQIARSLAGLSQDHLGELIGVTFQQIQKYEKGLNRISASRLYELAQILEQPINSFFDDYVPDEYYYNFGVQEPAVINKKNREILSLLKSFSKIDNCMVRKNILSLLNSIASCNNNPYR